MSDDPTRKLSDRLDEIVGLLGTVVDRFGALETGQADLNAKVDARLHETRPIWEQILSRLTTIEERQQSMDRKIRWIYDEFKDLKVRLRPTFSDVAKLLNDRDNFEKRILKLQTERS